MLSGKAVSYTHLFNSDDRLETIMDQTPMDIADLIDQLNERGEKVIFVGDGIDAVSYTHLV